MKKITFIFFNALVLGLLLTASGCNPDTKVKQSTLLVVPDVTSIAEGKYQNKGYTSLTFKGTRLKTIGKYAFKGNKITKLKLPESLTHIEEGAFENNNIETLVLPKLTKLGKNAFKGNKLKEVTLRGIIASFDKTAFTQDAPHPLPTFKVPTKEVMEWIVTTFTTENADGTKTPPTVKTTNEQELTQETINTHVEKVKKKPALSGVCTAKFIVDGVEQHTAQTPCGQSIASEHFPKVPTKPHYTLLLWGLAPDSRGNSSGASQADLSKLKIEQREMELHAIWKANTYTVKFISHDATEPTTENVVYREKVDKGAIIAPRREHYTFDTWYKDKKLTTSFDFDTDIIEGHTSLYAKWTPKKYTVNFYVEPIPTVYHSIEVDYGTTISSGRIMPNPQWSSIGGLPGKNTFDTWYTDDTYAKIFDFNTVTVKGDTHIYGKWTNPSHVVRFVAFYEDENPVDAEKLRIRIVYGDKIQKPTEPLDLEEEYTWPVKWFTDEDRKEKDRYKFKDGNNVITEDITLYGMIKKTLRLTFMIHDDKEKYPIAYKELNAYPIAYKEDMDIDINGFVRDKKLDLRKPKGFDNSNLEFDGWYKQEDYKKHKKPKRLSQLSNIKYSTTLYGRWIKTYTVIYTYKKKSFSKKVKETVNAFGLYLSLYKPDPEEDDEISKALGFTADKPKEKVPNGYELTFCVYDDKELKTVSDSSHLTEATTTVYGAWKFAASSTEHLTGKTIIDCRDTKEPKP